MRHPAASLFPALLALSLSACELPESPMRIVTVTRNVAAPVDESPRQESTQPAPPPLRATPHGSSAALERLGIAVRTTPGGAAIVAIDLDGPGAQSGAQLGDIVVGVNGVAIGNAAELDQRAGAAPDGTVVLDVLRKGELRQVAVEGADPATSAAWNALGLQVRELPREALKALGVAYGVLVTKVRAPADRTRILPGDVIVGVDSTLIRSMEEFNKLVAGHAAVIGLLVRRADSDQYISFDLGSAPRGGGASLGGSLPRLDETLKTRQKTKGTPLRT